MRFVLTLLALPTALFAQEFDLLSGDTPLPRDEVIALTDGVTLTFYDGGQSRYDAGGAYSYTYASGASAFGQFAVGEDGVVCVTFRNTRSRCDRFVHSHGRLVLLTEAGGRFPVRP